MVNDSAKIQFVLAKKFCNFLKFLLIACAGISFACGSVLPRNDEIVRAETLNVQKQSTPNPTPFLEPIVPFDKYPESLRREWQAFISNGQYRLAQPTDMNFPPNHKDHIPENPMPFSYSWGDLGYEKRVEDDHLAAIVVDTTRNDAERFSLVIFSPPKGKKEIYEKHWLFRNVDLSKTTVNRASGELYVRKYYNENSQSCSVRWNQRKKQFDCDLKNAD